MHRIADLCPGRAKNRRLGRFHHRRGDPDQQPDPRTARRHPPRTRARPRPQSQSPRGVADPVPLRRACRDPCRWGAGNWLPPRPRTHPGWARNWSRTSSPRSTNRLSPFPAPVPPTLSSRGPHPARDRRRVGVQVLWAPRRPRRHRTGHPGVRLVDQGRTSRPNRKLKLAFFLAAFASLADPTSRTYYDRKRAEGKNHNTALICLARRRCDVLYAMLRNKTHYKTPDVTAAA